MMFFNMDVRMTTLIYVSVFLCMYKDFCLTFFAKLYKCYLTSSIMFRVLSLLLCFLFSQLINLQLMYTYEFNLSAIRVFSMNNRHCGLF